MFDKRLWTLGASVVLCVLCLFGCKTQTTYGEFSYFENGKIQTKSFSDLSAMETQGKGAESTAWKTEPVLIVQREMVSYLPELKDTAADTKTFEKNGWKAITAASKDTKVECYVAIQEKNRVIVNILVNEAETATAELKRPIGEWWYVTAFEYEK